MKRNRPQHQLHWLNLRLSGLQISPFSSSAFHHLQSGNKEKKSLLTTTAQSRRAETSAKDVNPMSAVTSGIVPFVKQKKHLSQSVLLSSSADQGSPSWRQERISIQFLSMHKDFTPPVKNM